LSPLPPDTTLLNVAGSWKLYYKGREYATLASATCREDALAQVAEMLSLAQENLKEGVESGPLARPKSRQVGLHRGGGKWQNTFDSPSMSDVLSEMK